jgi:hypothetical protein
MRLTFGLRINFWELLCLCRVKTYTTGGLFGFFMYFIRHCLIYRPSDSTVSEDVEIEPRTIVTLAFAVRRVKMYQYYAYTVHTCIKKILYWACSVTVYCQFGQYAFPQLWTSSITHT